MSQHKLSKEALIEYAAVLKQEKEQVQQSIMMITRTLKSGAKEISGDLSAFPMHLADLASDTASYENLVVLLDREQQKLKKINTALYRIHEETYGVCESCGELISPKRLKIVPDANLCIGCQSKTEKKRKF